MAEVDPTGQRGKAKRALRDLLAESTTFQDAIGATGTPEEKIAAAKLRLHRTAYTPSGDFERPFGLLTSTGNDKNESNAVYQFAVGGDIELRLERDIPQQYRPDSKCENAEVDFENFYEGVMADAMALSVNPGCLAINSWDIIEGPFRYEDPIYGIRILVNWGMQ